MRPDNKTAPLAIAIAIGIAANIAAVALSRPAMPTYQELADLVHDPIPDELLQLRYIANIGQFEFPGFDATWPAWRRSRNIEDCRPQPNKDFKPCTPLAMPRVVPMLRKSSDRVTE